MKSLTKVLGISLVLIVVAGIGIAVAQAQGTIKIVTSWPMQGAMIPEGTAMKQAVDLAVKHHGGAVGGFKIEVVNRDDASPTTGSWDGTVEAEIAQKAVADPDVMVYLGPITAVPQKSVCQSPTRWARADLAGQYLPRTHQEGVWRRGT